MFALGITSYPCVRKVNLWRVQEYQRQAKNLVSQNVGAKLPNCVQETE